MAFDFSPKETRREFFTKWALAIKDGRVVRYNDGLSFKSFLTLEERDTFLCEMRRAGLDAEIVGGV